MSNHTHPFDAMLYEIQDDGTIKVSGRGIWGIFTDEGRWIEGELRQADPQLCVWVANNPDMSQQLTTSRMAGRDHD